MRIDLAYNTLTMVVKLHSICCAGGAEFIAPGAGFDASITHPAALLRAADGQSDPITG